MSIKMQAEYGDEIQVVFVSVGNDSPDQVQSFALAKKWLGGRAMWTNEPPFSTGLKTIPAAVLLASDGEVLVVGNPGEIHGKITDLIDKDLKQRTKGPKDAPAALKSTWSDFGKGNWAKAMSSAQALIDKPPAKDGEATVAAAQAALEAIHEAIERRFEIAKLHLDAGLFDRAQEELAAIAKAVKGHAELTERHADALARANGEDLAAERAAAAALAKIEKKLYASGPDDGSAKQLRTFADKYPGTKAAERAEYLEQISEKK
jgi:hypothetical protein